MINSDSTPINFLDKDSVDLNLQIGNYIIMPTTFYAGEEASFIVRVLTDDSSATIKEITPDDDWYSVTLKVSPTTTTTHTNTI